VLSVLSGRAVRAVSALRVAWPWQGEGLRFDSVRGLQVSGDFRIYLRSRSAVILILRRSASQSNPLSAGADEAGTGQDTSYGSSLVVKHRCWLAVCGPDAGGERLGGQPDAASVSAVSASVLMCGLRASTLRAAIDSQSYVRAHGLPAAMPIASELIQG